MKKLSVKNSRVLSLFLVLVFVVSALVGCGGTAESGISIDEAETALSGNDDWTFSKTQNTDGRFTFEAQFDYLGDTYHYSGRASKKQNVDFIKMEYVNIDTYKLTDEYTLKEVASKSYNKYTMSDIRALKCVVDTWILLQLLDPSYEESTLGALIPTFVSLYNGTACQAGKWSVSARVNEWDKTVSVTASYKN